MDYQEFLKTWQPFDEYRVRARLVDIAAGVPKNPELWDYWLNSQNKKITDEERERIKAATADALESLKDEKANLEGTCFKSDDKGLYVEGRQVKSMLKEAANIIKAVAPTKKSKKTPRGIGITAFKSKMADHVFVVEDVVHLMKDGEHVSEPTRIDQRPISVITPMGPRSSIKVTEVVEGAEIEFTVRRLDDSGVPEKSLYACLAFAQQLGLGASRSQGMGKFQILSVEKTESSSLTEDE